jgi:hypothetical protein
MVGLKNITNPYHYDESSAYWFRVRHPAMRCSSEMSSMMKNKVELIYCIMVVATAVMAGIVKCTAAATCGNCGDFLEP